jgi:molybdopterin-guanine dinucleotide biosynthesis protein A
MKTVRPFPPRVGGNIVLIATTAEHRAPALAAFYATAALPAFQAALDGAGKRDLRSILAALDVRHVDEDHLRAVDANLRSFTDLDTPEDLARARRRFGNRIG